MAKKTTIKKKRRKMRPSPNGSNAIHRRRKKVWINVLPHDQWFEVDKNITLYKALQQENIDFPSDCGGMGKCGKCRIRILTSIQEPRREEDRLGLSEDDIHRGMRLACRVRVKKDLAIYLGESEPELDFFQILKISQIPELDLDPLVVRHAAELDTHLQQDGSANIKLLRSSLHGIYPQLEITLTSLRTLAGSLEKKNKTGSAVIHRGEYCNTLLDYQREEKQALYGLVFDLGTSTLVAKLINLEDGRQEAAVSCLNSQSRYGADVISRLQHVDQHPRGLEELHHLLLDDLNRLIKRLMDIVGLKSTDLFVAVVAGNTTMQHLLLGIDPSGIARAPFPAVINEGFVTRGEDIGLLLHREAWLYIMPSKSGYIGGDMVSVILAAQAAEQQEKVILGLDLGTNGELFLGNGERLLTCSTAAGPALEGARISCGSIAKAGAIEGVRFQDGTLHYKNIGNIPPVSICGSGLVDLVAVLLHCGVIDRQGLIIPPVGEGVESLRGRVFANRGVNDFLIADAEEAYHRKPLFLTQKDVRELQYAKAAVAAGIDVLCGEWGIDPLAIDHIYLAGALGNYVNIYSAMRIGLIPMIDPERIISIGNAASTGAVMALLARDSWQRAQQLAASIEHIELSTAIPFTESYIANMDFPGINLWDKREI